MINLCEACNSAAIKFVDLQIIVLFISGFAVPPWAKKVDGCMLTAIPSLTVTYLPEQATVELTSDCGLDGTRRIACKGQAVS